MKMDIFESFDGTKLALHRAGEGRPLVLLHGLFSSAEIEHQHFVTTRSFWRSVVTKS